MYSWFGNVEGFAEADAVVDKPEYDFLELLSLKVCTAFPDTVLEDKAGKLPSRAGLVEPGSVDATTVADDRGKVALDVPDTLVSVELFLALLLGLLLVLERAVSEDFVVFVGSVIYTRSMMPPCAPMVLMAGLTANFVFPASTAKWTGG